MTLDPTATILIVLAMLALYPLVHWAHEYTRRFGHEVRDALAHGLPAHERERVLDVVDEQSFSGIRLTVARVLMAAPIRFLVWKTSRNVTVYSAGEVLVRSLVKGGALGREDATVLLRNLGDATQIPRAVAGPVDAVLPGTPGMRYAYWLVNDAANESLGLETFTHDPECVVDHGFSKAVVLRGDADLKPWEAEGFEVIPGEALFAWDKMRVALKLPADAIVLGWHEDDVIATTDAYIRVADALDDQDANPEICALTGPYFVATKAELDARVAEVNREVAQIDAALNE